MFSLERTQQIEKKVSTLEKLLDNVSLSLRHYREITIEAADKKPVEPEPPERLSRGKTGRGKSSDSSLFDGLLQDFIRESGFHIQTGSEEETNYGIIKENTPDSIVEIDSAGIVFSVNPSFVKFFGYREADLLGCPLFQIIPEYYQAGLREAMQRALSINFGKIRDTVDDIIVFMAHSKSGELKSSEGLFYAYERDGKPVLVLRIRDLAYSRSLFEELREVKDHYDALSETISETIIRLDENFVIIFVNSAVQKTFGYQREEVFGQHFSILFPPGVFRRNSEIFKKYFFVDDQDRKTLGMDVTLELLGSSKNRGLFPMEMSFGNSKEYNGRTLTCILRDITQRKHTERKLRHLAFHDKLTGLGNRDLFNTDIAALCQNLQKEDGKISALMFLDLDGFKQVNDTLGHKAGDILLIETARRLRNCVRETDSVYRLGGDEFVVLLKGIHKRESAAVVGTKLLQAVRDPCHIESGGNKTTVNVGVSIGIAVIPDDGDSAETITKNADLAMYSAKGAGKNTFTFFNRDMDRRALERWDLEQGIKKGLAERQFILHYQPLTDWYGRILGVEALIRWNHPERGIIRPGEFIPIAEETGLIVPMGSWIMETACRDISRQNLKGFPELFVSVNLSPKQFEHPDFLNTIGGVIQRTGINPGNLKLELTETSIMGAPEEAIKKMHSLKDKYPGISIAIDDFGTGYSSLSYLSRLPVDIIKIDLSFVTKLFQETNRKVVNAIINMAESLDLGLVAEGVETESQLQYFVERGCGLLQGNYFYKPLSIEVLEEALGKN